MRHVSAVIVIFGAAAMSGGAGSGLISAGWGGSGSRAVWTVQGERAGGRWASRLEELLAEQPRMFFELGEEMADGALTAAELEQAKHLFRLAGAMDGSLGASSALALADLADSEGQLQERRRLIALAGLLDARAAVLTVRGETMPVAGAVAAAEALAYYRQGEGDRALSALGESRGMQVLAAHAHALRGGMDRFLEDCNLYRKGERPPQLGEDDISLLIRLEAALLAEAGVAGGFGDGPTWSDSLLSGSDEPLIEVDPDNLAETFGVDVSRPWYRDGRWVRRGG